MLSMPPLRRRAGQHLWRALCASLLTEAAGFGGLNYVHRPATDFTTYNALNSQGPGDASSNLPTSPLTFNGGELEVAWGATGPGRRLPSLERHVNLHRGAGGVAVAVCV